MTYATRVMRIIYTFDRIYIHVVKVSFSLFSQNNIFVPVRSNRHNVMLFVPENAILLMSQLKLIVAAAVLRKSVTSIVASL